MTNETLYRAIGDIDETYIAEAKRHKKTTSRALLRWGTVAAALCLLVGGALLSNLMGGFGNGGGFFARGDATVFAAHREDFTPEIDSAVLAQFDDPTEVKKAYLMRTNEWFLADDLTDFSQAVTTDVVYVVPGGQGPDDSDAAYSIYHLDDTGKIQWSCTAYPPDNTLVPFEFSGLTYPLIEHALATLEHEDYIITYAPQLGTVFIWVRDTAEGDVILAYPTRPDLLGLEHGEAYTLHELQEMLTKAYHEGNHDTEHWHEDRIYGEDRYQNGNHHADDHHTQHSATRHFIHSMDCSNMDCTDPNHFHNCPSDCTDPAHYHNCPTDCSIEAHQHPRHQNSSGNGNGNGNGSGHNNGHNNGHGNGHH